MRDIDSTELFRWLKHTGESFHAQDSIRKTMLGEHIETPNETHKKKERK